MLNNSQINIEIWKKDCLGYFYKKSGIAWKGVIAPAWSNGLVIVYILNNIL